MADLWSDVRNDVLRRLNEHSPTMPFEMRIMIAEDAAREVGEMGTAFPDGGWPLDTKSSGSEVAS